MLSTAANVRPLQGAVLEEVTPAARPVPLQRYRLSDGSAAFGLPQGWQCRELGRGLTDTTTGDHWEENGEPGYRHRDYVNFQGRNPRYREQMQEVNS